MRLIYTLLSFLFLAVVAEAQEASKGYTSWLPAPKADDAMLLGNGIMGAMVFGHPHQENIILNQADIYLPTGLPKQPIDQASRLEEIRSLILEGKGTEAAQIPVEQSMAEAYGGQAWSDPYIPAFDVKIQSTAANIEAYERQLDFASGVARVSWIQEGKHFERTQFISRANNLLVIQMKADTTFDARISFDRHPVAWNQWDYINKNIKDTRYYAQDDKLYYHSDFVHQWEGNIAGFDGVAKVFCPADKLTASGASLQLQNVQEFTLILRIDSYKMGEAPRAEAIAKDLDAVADNYQQLLEAHKAVHSELFNRVSLDLHGTEADRALNSEVMMQQAKQGLNPAFIEKQFYAARYNILSATGANPPNLQGIWGYEWEPPWTSDYTHDGNLPTAISSFLVANMPELMLSYFDYHDARLPYYRDNAKKLYGCRGIQVPSHSSSHGWNVHFDPIWCLSFWNGGAAWAAHFYYDYWLYTNDKVFLAERAYPFMKEAALFYEDFLTLGENGKYVFNPSYSPENNPANNPSQATINATMDVMLAKELLRNLLAAGKVLQEDKLQMQQWQQMLAKLPAYEVDANGVLREWLWPGYEENHAHRHISQLYGMYAMPDPEIVHSQVLMEGVRKAVEERMKVRRQEGGGIMVFGMVQMAWVAENLGDAALVEDILSWLSAQYWSNSLATYHDPNGLFNMDLSGGFQSAVIGALVRTEPGKVTLLPAKPQSWSQGSLQGVQGRNQLQIEELSWAAQGVTVALSSPKAQSLKVVLAPQTEQLWVNGKQLKINKAGPKPYVVLKMRPGNTLKLKMQTK